MAKKSTTTLDQITDAFESDPESFLLLMEKAQAARDARIAREQQEARDKDAEERAEYLAEHRLDVATILNAGHQPQLADDELDVLADAVEARLKDPLPETAEQVIMSLPLTMGAELAYDTIAREPNRVPTALINHNFSEAVRVSYLYAQRDRPGRVTIDFLARIILEARNWIRQHEPLFDGNGEFRGFANRGRM